jgi:hypothetical protein
MPNFADSFAKSFGTAQELAYKKWLADQETDPQSVAGKLLPTAMLMGNTDLVNKLLDMQKGKPIQPSPTKATGWLDAGLPQQPTQTTGVGIGGGAQILPTGKGFKVTANPAAAQIAKDEMSIVKQTSEQGLFQKQFSRSYKELTDKYPDIGEKGWESAMLRFKVRNIDVPLDELPETKAFVTELQPRANQQARTIEGGRVTDNDRKIYADAYPNAILHPTGTNIRLMSNKLLDMDAKGGNIGMVMKDLLTSPVPIDKKIALQVLEEKIPNFSPETHKIQIDSETGKIRVVPRKE